MARTDDGGVFETTPKPLPWQSSAAANGANGANGGSERRSSMPPPPPFRTPRSAGAATTPAPATARPSRPRGRDVVDEEAAAFTAPRPNLAPPDSPPPEQGRARRHGHGFAFWFFLVFFAALLAGIFGGAIWFLRQVNPPGAPGPEVTVTVPAGMDRDGFVDLLASEGVVTSKFAFDVYLRVETLPTVREGDYVFNAPSKFSDVLDVLRRPPEVKKVKVTFPEGFTVRQVTERVAKEVPGVTAQQFTQAMAAGTVRSKYMPADITSYEGFLFPDTYLFAEGSSAEDVLQAMVTQFDKVADEVGIGSVPGVAPYDVVKVASMVEREARVDEDRAKIARVIYNRLNAAMPLQIDATLLYAAPPGTEPSQLNYKQDGPYNTYTRKGLPPTPIANPGRASLDAAAHPEAGPWLYYVLSDKDGHHTFNENLKDHEKARADARARGVF